jgi:hypothetical protein
MAKKPTAKSTPAVASPAPAAKSTTPPKRLIATARPSAGRVSKTSPVAKDATKAAPAPTAVPTAAAVVAPPKATTAKPTARAAAKPAKAAPAAAQPTKPIKLTSSRKKAPQSPAPRTVTYDDIAVRAYLIAEHRQNHGIWGEPHLDWIEAERQLKAELLP